MIELSSDILNNIENNKKRFIKFLSDILNIKIIELDFVEFLKFDYVSEYGFILYKFKIQNEKKDEIEIYLNFINNNRIKQSIFCYWCQIYEEELEKNNSDITMNKVLIKEDEINEFKRSIFLEMENNNTEILKYGTQIYLVNLLKYLKKFQLENIEYFPNSLNEDDILLIGIKANKQYSEL